jgi:hypothetical protein
MKALGRLRRQQLDVRKMGEIEGAKSALHSELAYQKPEGLLFSG